ncbi:MAG: ABC transporter permease subunit, partial [Patescibacteria group bacterium]|nr:ABC transporter permease subunit [Patescibacteria group bacterium]
MRTAIRRSRRVLMPLATAALVLGAWQTLAMTVTAVRGVDFPTPWATGASLLELLSGAKLADRSIYRHVYDSLARWAAGFGLAAMGGVLFGLLAGCRRGVEELTMPVVHILQLVPGLAWIPVALLLFGIGEQATVFMITITAFSPIAINVLSGVKRVDVTYVRAARMLGATGTELFTRVMI